MSQDGHCICELPGAKIVRRWRFGKTDILQWIERKKNCQSK
ncbi:MAG: hypothetical protein Q8R91_00575 [Candidatus Omnitrophota bacterium]|nr:hypothetical protein [Candidatus Omnitrophota bacterium]